MLNTNKKMIHLTILGVSALFMAPALAHSGSHAAMSFGSGFAHPFSGWDHLLAIVALGLWASQQQRPARWILLSLFPVMMILGALASVAGFAMPGVEAGIAGSLAVMGLLIAFALRMPGWFSAILITLFAVLHGHAHGSELQSGVSFVLYGAGFASATALLQLAGLWVGSLSARRLAARAVRLSGAGISLAGICLLAGMA